MAAVLTLRSAYQPDPRGHGTISLRLENRGTDAVERFRLALTSVVKLDPGPDSGVRLAQRVSGYHELARSPELVLAPGEELVIAGLAVGHTPRHANDGPASAFVVLDDGSTIDVDVEPMTTPEPTPPSSRGRGGSAPGVGRDPALVPWPAGIDGSGRRALSASAGLGESASVGEVASSGLRSARLRSARLRS